MIRDNFWDNVAIGEENECWEWQRSRNTKGYGHFRLNGKTQTTHRYVYCLINGSIPEGMHVLHTCDNRACCNPKHLWLGTNADNVADRNKKGRQGTCRGEEHKLHKLTGEQVLEIRKLYIEGLTNKTELGRMFGVTRQLVIGILRGRNWPHLEEAR